MPTKETNLPCSASCATILSSAPGVKSSMSVRKRSLLCRRPDGSDVSLQMATAASSPAAKVVPPPARKAEMRCDRPSRSKSVTVLSGCTTSPSVVKVAKPKRSPFRSMGRSRNSACFARSSRIALLPPPTDPDIEPEMSSTTMMSIGTSSRSWPSRQDFKKQPTQRSDCSAAPAAHCTRPATDCNATTCSVSGGPVLYECSLNTPW
mmetsp:Transcript_28675/g.72689  ORF Transcript_28675/g.72689 Transcript_28675/m.72689 type:complete len:206 (-) Transcript_28675:204-821(-)